MTCDLAVSIAKAQVQNENLMELLDESLRKKILEVLALQNNAPDAVAFDRYLGSAISIGRVVVSIDAKNTIMARASASRYDNISQEELDVAASRLATQASELFGQATQAAFTSKAAAVLAKYGTVVQKDVDVDNQGVVQTATLLTLRF